MKKIGKRVGIVLAVLVVLNLPIVVRCLILDKTDPYYDNVYERKEILRSTAAEECPDVIITDQDKEFLKTVFNDPTILAEIDSFAERDERLAVLAENATDREFFDAFYSDPEVLDLLSGSLSEEDCSRLIALYDARPSDICEIHVSDSSSMPGTIYLIVDFYETEADAYDYPSLSLWLTAYKHSLDPSRFSLISYKKEIRSYSMKVSDDRANPMYHAAFEGYTCLDVDIDNVVEYYKNSCTLTPIKFKHLRKFYLGWFDAMMSV